MRNIPEISYGILQQTPSGTAGDETVEQIRTLGFAVLDSGYSAHDIQVVSSEFNSIRKRYIETHGESRLKAANEFHNIRAPLTQGSAVFLKLALNEPLLSILKKLIVGKFILNQQNGIINPPRESYNQAAWHRDLPYQHFVSSRPLAINALFCVDDFTIDNGATFVLPASHKCEEFPSAAFIKNNAIQVEAKAGSFILLDCMLFHAGGFNKTQSERRAVNHVYNIPYFKQQINIPKNLERAGLSSEAEDILGFHYIENDSVEHYLTLRGNKKY